MVMDMNFPHPRSGAQAGSAAVDYSTLVASAMSRQATSHTVRTLLREVRNNEREMNGLRSRIDFFARHGATAPQYARGAFLPSLHKSPSPQAAKFESAVNLAGSIYGKDDQIETVQPELQVAERGTEF
jgi:hypothetical protein